MALRLVPPQRRGDELLEAPESVAGEHTQVPRVHRYLSPERNQLLRNRVRPLLQLVLLLLRPEVTRLEDILQDDPSFRTVLLVIQRHQSFGEP